MKKIFILLLLIFAFSVSGFSQKKRAEWFSVSSITGTTFDLDELRGKNVVLLFWSTSCEICRSELPQLNKLVDDNKDTVFLALTPEDNKKIEPFLRKHPLKFNVIADGFDILIAYAEKTPKGSFNMPFPTFFLINKEGEIEIKTEGAKGFQKISNELKRLSTVVSN
jgi:peroxiredoxin